MKRKQNGQNLDFAGKIVTSREWCKKRSNNAASATLVFNFKSPFKCIFSIKKYIVMVWPVVIPVMVS